MMRETTASALTPRLPDRLIRSRDAALIAAIEGDRYESRVAQRCVATSLSSARATRTLREQNRGLNRELDYNPPPASATFATAAIVLFARGLRVTRH